MTLLDRHDYDLVVEDSTLGHLDRAEEHFDMDLAGNLADLDMDLTGIGVDVVVRKERSREELHDHYLMVLVDDMLVLAHLLRQEEEDIAIPGP